MPVKDALTRQSYAKRKEFFDGHAKLNGTEDMAVGISREC